MTGVILAMPVAPSRRGGTVHVMGDLAAGFHVSHESASGNSWGELFGPYPDGQAAIAKAYAVNRDDYGGDCDVAVCDAALTDRTGVITRAPLDREDF
jgi:hypothetical protein